MANKRLGVLLETGQLLDTDRNQDVATHNAKRYKSTVETTPLQRMLQRHVSSSNCSSNSCTLSPITELSQNMRNTLINGGTPKTSKLRSYNSVSSSVYDSSVSLDDEYMAMFELEQLEQEPLSSSLEKLPCDLDALISGQLKSDHVAPRAVRRCLSMDTLPGKPGLRKTPSMNDADIMNALGDGPQLIGDLSKPCALPVLHSGMRHADLATISCDTLAQLMRGEFVDLMVNYQIIDCRYPYEFDGGHIRGALNLYTREQIMDAFPAKTASPSSRSVYVFHCEFSSERGPKLMRFLRNNDRSVHTENYPTLDYPELYLLHNGYKEFHARYIELCDPRNYVPMLAPAHNEEYRLFRAKTKSWNCGDSDGGDRLNDGGSTGRSRSLRKSRSRLMYAE